MSFSATDIAHECMKRFALPGTLCIDATAGKGGDALFLCSLVGKEGRVIAFDIQEQAVEMTRRRVAEAGFEDICTVVLDGHQNMDAYAQKGSVSFICFNLGWLPGGDHSVYTAATTTIEAIEKGLDLLAEGGAMTVCIYYGGENGFEERDALMEFLPTLDSTRYTVLVHTFANRTGNQPIPVIILKGIA